MMMLWPLTFPESYVWLRLLVISHQVASRLDYSGSGSLRYAGCLLLTALLYLSFEVQVVYE